VLYVEEIHRGVLHALAYARSLAADKLVAVAVVSDLGQLSALEEDWARYGGDVPLEIIYSPAGEISRAVIGYVDQVSDSGAIGGVTVLIPELAIRHWWEELLHNQTALSLKGRLLFRPGTVVTSVPYRPSGGPAPRLVRPRRRRGCRCRGRRRPSRRRGRRRCCRHRRCRRSRRRRWCRRRMSGPAGPRRRARCARPAPRCTVRRCSGPGCSRAGRARRRTG